MLENFIVQVRRPNGVSGEREPAQRLVFITWLAQL